MKTGQNRQKATEDRQQKSSVAGIQIKLEGAITEISR